MTKLVFIKKPLLALILMSGAFTASAASVPGNSVISVSGNIISSACAISAEDLTKTVDLGEVTASDLLGGTYKPVYFSFNIYGCDAALSTVTATVSGTEAGSDVPGYGPDSVLANTGDAVGVAVGMLGLTDVTSASAAGALPLDTESAALTLTDVGNGSDGGVLNLGAQIVPVVALTKATAGTVVSTATILFTYE